MKKGEIWWANLPQPAGRRPVLLLSRNEAYQLRTMITIAPITTTIRHIPIEVLLNPSEGLSKQCVINLDSITTIPKDLLDEYIISLTMLKLNDVHRAIHFALQMDDCDF